MNANRSTTEAKDSRLRRWPVWLAFACGLVFLLFPMLDWLQEKLIYYPTREIREDPRAYGIAFEDVWFETDDGERLHAWFIPAAGGSGANSVGRTILYFHGNAGNLGDRAFLAELYKPLHVSFLFVEYRGYGKSSGRPHEAGLYRDGTAAWRYLTEIRKIPAGEIILFGTSLGAAVAAELATRVPARGLVLETPFTNTREMARRHYPFLPSGRLLKNRYDTLGRVAHLRLPKLVIYAGHDSIAPPSMAKALIAAMPETRDFFVVEAADHNDLVLGNTAAYLTKLRAFVVQ